MAHSPHSKLPFAAATLLFLSLGACKTIVLPGGGEEGGEEGGSEEGGNGTTGAPVDPTVGGANCGELSANTLAILETNCARCHSPGITVSAFTYVTNVDEMIKNGKVIPGDSNNSPIWRRMTSTDLPMPPAAETVRPSETEIATVATWIDECAGATGCGDQPWISRDEAIQMVADDLGKVGTDARPFIRYFSLVHLHNYGWCDDQIDLYRHGLSKLVNSLSLDTKVIAPEPIDPNRLIFRIDMRDYNWDRPVTEIKADGLPGESFKDVWELIVARDPYAIEFDGDIARDVIRDAQTNVFLLQADAFLEVSSQPPLYHDILSIPFTRKELEEGFGFAGVNSTENLILDEIKADPDRVARAAFHESGVSQNHRVIERFDFPDNSNRAYWLSYDFAFNGSEANVFVRPFGNPAIEAILSDGERFLGFHEAGGEMIFNLPNGMQGYMVVEANGDRLDEAPIDIVQDKNAVDGIVTNGVSCMGCHSAGIINKEDDLRWEIDKGTGEGDFNADELEAIRALYPPREEMNKLLKLDGDRFNFNVQSAGVPTGGEQEPILEVFLAFTDEDVDVRRAAAELWITETALREKLGQLSPDLDNLANGQKVRRLDFTNVYADSICELLIGHTKKCPNPNPVLDE
jgi:hypothetical protein